MVARLENASAYQNVLGEIYERAGDPEGLLVSEDLAVFPNIEQATLDAIVADYRPGQPSAFQIRAERDRRKCALVGVDTLEDLQAAIIYGMQDATDLLDIRQSRQWTEAEAARAAQLRAVREALSLLDYTAIALIAAGVEDYENNEHWPV